MTRMTVIWMHCVISVSHWHTQKKTDEAKAAVLASEVYEDVAYAGADTTIKNIWKAGDAGYVVEVTPSGFGGNLDVMVGVDNDGVCTGVSIVSPAETSGLGANATKEPSGSPKETPIGMMDLVVAPWLRRRADITKIITAKRIGYSQITLLFPIILIKFSNLDHISGTLSFLSKTLKGLSKIVANTLPWNESVKKI